VDRGRYYSTNWGNLHLISLDTNRPLERAITGEGEMLRWLEADLKSARQYWRVAVVHHPPYAGGPNENNPTRSFVRDYIVPILENHGVQLVLSGDEHSYQRSYDVRAARIVNAGTGTIYVTAGGGGADLYPVHAHPLIARAQSVHHYLKVEVNGSRMIIRAIGSEGSPIDQFALSPLPVISDDVQLQTVSLTPSGLSGKLLRIRGRSLAPEERFAGTLPFPIELSDTSVSIDGATVPLIYVSPSQIWGHVPFDVQTPFFLKITTPNGSVDRTILSV
jgi:hypothetical protein